MLLQRSTKLWLRRIAVLLLTATLAACASGPESASRPQREVLGANGVETVRDIPPQAQTLFEQAVAVMASGDHLEAVFRFEEFVLQYPGYPGAHVNLAIIHAGNGDDAAAEGSITDALVIDPTYAPALNQLGMLLRRQGKFMEAESAYQKALTAQPNYALVHYNLGVLNELYLQRLAEALRHYERYQELGGEDEQVQKWITDLTRRVASS